MQMLVCMAVVTFKTENTFSFCEHAVMTKIKHTISDLQLQAIPILILSYSGL